MTFVPNLVIFLLDFFVCCIVYCRTKKGLYKGILLKRKRTASARMRKACGLLPSRYCSYGTFAHPAISCFFPFKIRAEFSTAMRETPTSAKTALHMGA